MSGTPRLLGKAARRASYAGRRFYWRCRLGARARLCGPVLLGPRLTLKARGAGCIELGPRVELEYDVNMESTGLLRIGGHTFVGHGTTIGCDEAVTIGRDCLIGEYVSIRDNGHRFDDTARPIRVQGQATAPVVIEDDVWIGAKATVMPGVRIGAGSVVGANAVVTRDIPPGMVAVGAPARAIKRRGEA